MRTDIKTLLDTVDGIEEVSALPKLTFSGYPAVTVTPSELESDYETDRENLHVYAFQVRVFYEAETAGTGSAVDNIEETIENIIQVLDDEERRGGTRTIGNSLASNFYLLDIQPTPTEWIYMDEQELVVGELSVLVRVSFDIEG